MTGTSRLYMSASALALAGMAGRIGSLWWLPRVGAVLLTLIPGLMVFLAIIVPFIGLAALIGWLLQRLMKGAAFVLCPDSPRSEPEKQP